MILETSNALGDSFVKPLLYPVLAATQDLLLQSKTHANTRLYSLPKHDDDDSDDNDDSAFRDFGAPTHDKIPSTDTGYSFAAVDPRRRFLAELGNKLEKTRQTRLAYQSRIETLRGYAALEGLTLNHLSEEDFWSFAASVPFAREGDLVLLDNGNLRAIWGEDEDRHLGIQFLGDRMAQYVIFRRREGSDRISRVAGRDTFEGIKKQVQIFNLEAFLNA